MKKIFLIILFGGLCCTARVESQEFGRSLEIEGRHDIYPAGKKGLVLMDRSLKQMTDGSLAIGFSGYDSLLTKKWINYYPLTKGMTLAFRKVNEEGIYLLFASRDRKEYELIMANTEYGDYEQSKYSFSEPLQVSELEAFYDQVWIAGIVGPHPVVFKLNPAKNAYQTVPVGLPGRLKYVGQLKYYAPSKSLDYLIIAEVEKQEVVVWRSITTQGKVIVNERLPFARNAIRGIRSARLNDTQMAIAGQYTVGKKNRVEGMFTGAIGGENKLDFRGFKEIKAVSSYKRLQDIKRKGFEEAKSVKFNKANKNVYVDYLGLNKSGELEMTLEIYTDNFQARGTLEKEVIARDRTAQLDQNTYGRRTALSGNEGVDGVDDLMARGSATDQLQYRYMEQNLSKAVSDGMLYSHTGYQKFSTDMTLLEENAVFFGMQDSGRLNGQTNFKSGLIRYFYKGELLSFQPDKKQVSNSQLVKDQSMQLMEWYGDTALGVDFKNDGGGFTLYRFSLD